MGGCAVHSLKMIVAFTYIYNTIVNSQIRVIVMNFTDEHHKTMGLWFHPIFLMLLRIYRVNGASLDADVKAVMASGATIIKFIKSVAETCKEPEHIAAVKEILAEVEIHEGLSMKTKLCNLLSVSL